MRADSDIGGERSTRCERLVMRELTVSGARSNVFHAAKRFVLVRVETVLLLPLTYIIWSGSGRRHLHYYLPHLDIFPALLPEYLFRDDKRQVGCGTRRKAVSVCCTSIDRAISYPHAMAENERRWRAWG